jgi:hypothetical protein
MRQETGSGNMMPVCLPFPVAMAQLQSWTVGLGMAVMSSVFERVSEALPSVNRHLCIFPTNLKSNQHST